MKAIHKISRDSLERTSGTFIFKPETSVAFENTHFVINYDKKRWIQQKTTYLTARILLRRVLHSELPRSPVTRSATNVWQSMRLKNTPGLESPGSALRHTLKKKLHESASLSPLPSPKRPRSTVPNTNPPVTVPSPVHDEDMTTRGLLRGIIQTDLVAANSADRLAVINFHLRKISLWRSLNSNLHVGRSICISGWKNSRRFFILQKFTLGLNDVTELYAQLNKKDDKVGPSAEMERDAENEREHELERASEIPDSEPLIQEGKDHEMESQDDEEEEEEEVVLSSQENVFLSPEDDIVLPPTQTMTELLPESRDVQLEDREFVEEVEIGNVVEIEDVEIEDDSVEDEMVVDENVEEIEDEEVVKAEHENVEENPDTSQCLERITRRAHRSEGGGSVVGIPPATGVTKNFGAGLNPREKDLLDFVDENRENLQDFSDEEREPLGSQEFPRLHPPAELSSPEQRSRQHEASLAEGDVPELEEDDDAPEELNQSEEEELIDSGSASQSPELPQEEEENDDDDALSAELSIKTPAFVRQKRDFTGSVAQAMPTVFKVNAG
ncbi:hypothetical protein cypCar_00027263 [Cyprinus carpio]|nr:hypothetical protein cypCar_00027263 [Cyprinus carpio]